MLSKITHKFTSVAIPQVINKGRKELYFVQYNFAYQGFPFFGVEPVLLDEFGKVIEGNGEGYLVFRRPWPGIMRSLYGDHERFESVYFSKFPGYYCTGDGKCDLIIIYQ